MLCMLRYYGQRKKEVCFLKYKHQITRLSRNYTLQDVMELFFILVALCSLPQVWSPENCLGMAMILLWKVGELSVRPPVLSHSSYPTAENYQVHLNGRILLTHIVYSVCGLSRVHVFLFLPVTLLWPPLLCASLPWSRHNRGETQIGSLHAFWKP